VEAIAIIARLMKDILIGDTIVVVLWLEVSADTHGVVGEMLRSKSNAYRSMAGAREREEIQSNNASKEVRISIMLKK
jgi:uncharacterized lipoprotein YehR (DUF1307 family)